MALSDLTQLSAVKSWCGVTTSSDDALLGSLISQISRGIYNYLNRSAVLPTNLVETYDGNGKDQLLLRNWPVGAISQLLIDGQIVPAAAPIVAGSQPQPGFILEASDAEPPGAMQQVFLRGPYVFNKGRQNILVSYRAGYEILGEQQTVPASPPYQFVACAPYGPFALDTGVAYANGAPLMPVAAPNARGQYAVDPTTGAYTFSPFDAGQAVTLAYGYIPADLGQCALEWVSERYRYKDRIGLSSKSLGGQETVAYLTKPIPDFVALALTNFRRVIAN